MFSYLTQRLQKELIEPNKSQMGFKLKGNDTEYIYLINLKCPISISFWQLLLDNISFDAVFSEDNLQQFTMYTNIVGFEIRYTATTAESYELKIQLPNNVANPAYHELITVQLDFCKELSRGFSHIIKELFHQVPETSNELDCVCLYSPKDETIPNTL
jgi:hypothetical protein